MPIDACDLVCLDPREAESFRARLAAEDLAGAVARAQALGDPTRLSVALVLAEAGEACGCDVAATLGRSQALVAHHFKALRAAGLIESRRQGRLVLHRLTALGADLVDAVRAPATAGSR